MAERSEASIPEPAFLIFTTWRGGKDAWKYKENDGKIPEA